jgi:hypothetical protein
MSLFMLTVRGDVGMVAQLGCGGSGCRYDASMLQHNCNPVHLMHFDLSKGSSRLDDHWQLWVVN